MDLVMVKDLLTGHHYPLPREAAKAEPERYSILRRPAVDAMGKPLPPKFSI